MNKYQQFFYDLQEKFMILLYEIYDGKIDTIREKQINNRDRFLNELAQILLNYNIDNNALDLSMLEKSKLKNSLNSTIDYIFKDEYDFEKTTTDEILEGVAKDKYYSNSYIYSMGIDYNLKVVSDKILNQILNKKIQGKTYSDRIWENKNKVAATLKKEVKDFLNGNTTVNEINSRVSKRFNQNWNNSKRLVTNEIGRVQEEANTHWREKHNIKKVMYCATLDLKTCSVCGALDGKVYDNDNAPNLPKHVICRCTLISLVNENWRPKQRIDNETKQRIDWQSYEEWYKSQSDNEVDIFNKVKSIFKNNSRSNINDFNKGLKKISNENLRKLLEDSQSRTKFDKSKRRSSYYSSKDNTIYLTDNAKASTIAHELFHEIDYNYGITSTGILTESIENDYLRLKNISIGYGKEIKEMLEYKYSNIFYKNDFGKNVVYEEYRGISDIIHGMTNGKVDLGYGHRQKGYWERDRILDKETWAQYGRIFYENNNEVLKMLEEIFPNTTSKISKIIREVCN